MFCRHAVSGLLCLLLIVLVALAGCSREPQKAEVPPPPATPEVLSTTTLLATIADDERPHRGVSEGGHAKLPPARNQPAYFHLVFNDYGRGVAYIAEKGGKVHVVHNGVAGTLYEEVNEHKLALSPDGQRVAYGARIGDTWRMVIDGKEEGPFSGIGPPVFSPDSRHIAFEAQMDGKWHIIVDGRKSPASVSYYAKPVFSGDSKKMLYIENVEGDEKMRVVVADRGLTTLGVKKSSGVQLITNRDSTRVAAVAETGRKQKVIEFGFDLPDAVKEGPLYDAVDHLAFGGDGVSVAYAALRGERRFLILNGREERLPDGHLTGPPVVRPDNKGVGATMSSKDGSFLHQAFSHDGVDEKKYDEAADLTYSRDGSLHAYAARKGAGWFIVVNGEEGPSFDRVVGPLFSPDGIQVVYRARKDGRRFVVIADTTGKTVKQHAGYEQVFQPVFTADGKSIAYGVKDGQKLIWKVEKL